MKVKAKESVSHSVVSNSLKPHELSQCARLLCPWSFSGKNTEVGSHFLLQRIFPNQGSNPGLLHCTQSLYHLKHQKESESEVTQLCLTLCDPMDYSLPGFSIHGIFQARVLEWVAISFPMSHQGSPKKSHEF